VMFLTTLTRLPWWIIKEIVFAGKVTKEADELKRVQNSRSEKLSI
jgi:hypothetical protein